LAQDILPKWRLSHHLFESMDEAVPGVTAQQEFSRPDGDPDLAACIDSINRERALAEVVHRDTKDLLVRTMSALCMKRDLHMLAHKKYKRRYYSFMTPTLIISAAITCIQLAWPDSGLGGLQKSTIVAILSAINTVLIALTQMFEFQSLKDAHLTAGKAFNSLKDKQWSMSIKISRSLDRVRVERHELFPEQKDIQTQVENLANMISGKIEEIDQIVPPIPDWIEIIGKSRQKHVIAEIREDFGMKREDVFVSDNREKADDPAGLQQPKAASRAKVFPQQSDLEPPSSFLLTGPSSSAAGASSDKATGQSLS